MNTIDVDYKNRWNPNTVCGINCCLLWDPHKTQKHVVFAECRTFKCKTRWSMKGVSLSVGSTATCVSCLTPPERHHNGSRPCTALLFVVWRHCFEFKWYFSNSQGSHSRPSKSVAVLRRVLELRLRIVLINSIATGCAFSMPCLFIATKEVLCFRRHRTSC